MCCAAPRVRPGQPDGGRGDLPVRRRDQLAHRHGDIGDYSSDGDEHEPIDDNDDAAASNHDEHEPIDHDYCTSDNHDRASDNDDCTTDNDDRASDNDDRASIDDTTRDDGGAGRSEVHVAGLA